jgi:hypothetical protein
VDGDRVVIWMDSFFHVCSFGADGCCRTPIIVDVS